MKKSVATQYHALVESGRLTYDEAQNALAQDLDRLGDNLAQTNSNSFLKIFRKKETPKGLYIYGGVGRGKSMLMDMFFVSQFTGKSTGKPPHHKKWQVHFHVFMQEAHALLQKSRHKKNSRNTKRDPLYYVARVMARRARLICFDEFQVQDIADASILGRLFECLWREGVVIVATSNRAPDDLYAGGLNRHRFLPFIDMLRDNMQVVALDAARDYRLATLRAAPVWFTPTMPNTANALNERFAALTGTNETQEIATTTLNIMGRAWQVPSMAGVARLSFTDLCGRARGAADYWALAQTFHTLLIDDIPRLNSDYRNEAARFVALIDALYEHKVKLLCAAQTSPAQLYESRPDGHNKSSDGTFAFARTISRLEEMQSVDYLASAHIMLESLTLKHQD